MTRGTVDVAPLTAKVAGVPAVTITSTGTASNSATSAGNRSYLPSAHRYSMTIAALLVAEFAKAVAERADEVGFERGGRIAHEADARDFSRLLRAWPLAVGAQQAAVPVSLITPTRLVAS
jgi:hypothetical protein